MAYGLSISAMESFVIFAINSIDELSFFSSRAISKASSGRAVSFA
jgi:hypothetical protein